MTAQLPFQAQSFQIMVPAWISASGPPQGIVIALLMHFVGVGAGAGQTTGRFALLFPDAQDQRGVPVSARSIHLDLRMGQ